MSIIDKARVFIGTKILGKALCEACGHPNIDHNNSLLVLKTCNWKHCTCGGSKPAPLQKLHKALDLLDALR